MNARRKSEKNQRKRQKKLLPRRRRRQLSLRTSVCARNRGLADAAIVAIATAAAGVKTLVLATAVAVPSHRWGARGAEEVEKVEGRTLPALRVAARDPDQAQDPDPARDPDPWNKAGHFPHPVAAAVPGSEVANAAPSAVGVEIEGTDAVIAVDLHHRLGRDRRHLLLSHCVDPDRKVL